MRKLRFEPLEQRNMLSSVFPLHSTWEPAIGSAQWQVTMGGEVRGTRDRN